MRLAPLLILLPLAIACSPEADELDSEPGDRTFIPEGYAPVAPERVIFLGDSVTAGLGASRPSLRYRHLLLENDPEWPGAVDLRMAWPDLVEVDVSASGATTSTLRSRQLARLDELLLGPVQGESVVVFTVGGNDMQGGIVELLTEGAVAGGPLVDRLEENMIAILDYFQDPERFPDGTTLWFTNVYDPTDNVGQSDQCFFGADINALREPLFDANERLRTLAVDRSVAMIDMYASFQGHGVYHDDPNNPSYDADDPTLWFARDCIHPNDRGHHEIRRLLTEAMGL